MSASNNINSEITDALSNTLLATLGASQDVAISVQQQSFVHALGLAMHNGVTRQAAGQQIADALVTAGLAKAGEA